MNNIIATILVLIALSGCNSTDKIAHAIQDQNLTTIVEQPDINVSVDTPVDINTTNDIDIVNPIDINISIIASEVGMFGTGELGNEFWLLNASYNLHSDTGAWFAGQVFNQNCTVHLTTPVYILTDAFIQTDSTVVPLALDYRGNSFQVLSFDLNSTEYVKLYLGVTKDTTINISGKCLQSPQDYGIVGK